MKVFFFIPLLAKINWNHHSITYILNDTVMKTYKEIAENANSA